MNPTTTRDAVVWHFTHHGCDCPRQACGHVEGRMDCPSRALLWGPGNVHNADECPGEAS